MSELYQRIQNDAVAARKAAIKKEPNAEGRAKALSFLLAEIQAKMKTDRVTEISDPDTIVQIRKLRKETEEVLTLVKDDSTKSTSVQFELDVLDEYLPVPMSDDDVAKLANTAIDAIGATSMKDMGKVMQACMDQCPTVDRSQLSKAIKLVLAVKN